MVVKKRIKPPHINPQPPQIIPPREWKNFTELKFRVSDIQTNATATDIMDAFTTYGNVYSVEIETEETYVSPKCLNGTAYFIFKPVLAYPFWNKSLRFHGRVYGSIIKDIVVLILSLIIPFVLKV